MQILLNSRNELSLLFSLLLILTGDELSPLSPGPEVFLNSKEDFDDAEALVLPKVRVDWAVFFLGEGEFLADKSKIIQKYNCTS